MTWRCLSGEDLADAAVFEPCLSEEVMTKSSM